MSRQVFVFDPPDRFVAGTVGAPGERTFFLQARAANRIVSVALEKQQVALLAERVDALLDEVMRRTGGDTSVPAAAPLGTDDLDPLDVPISEEFRVGALGLGWTGELCIIEAHAASEEEGDVPDLEDDTLTEGPDCLRVRLTGAQARAFVKRATSLVSAGRQPCPFCSQPLDPSGHICPRANGYRRSAG